MSVLAPFLSSIPPKLLLKTNLQVLEQNSLTMFSTNLRAINVILALVLITLILPIMSSPLPESESEAYRWRGVYMCSKSNFQGRCNWVPFIPEDRDKCIHVQLDGENGVLPIGSVGPDWGLGVLMYNTPNCDSRPITAQLSCPGYVTTKGWWKTDEPKPDLFMKAKDIPASQQAHPGFGGEMARCPGSPVPWKRDLEEAREWTINYRKGRRV